MDERLERVYARWCARRVLHLWDAPEVVRRWLDEGDERLRHEAFVEAVTAWSEGNGERLVWAATAASEASEASEAEGSGAGAADAAAEAMGQWGQMTERLRQAVVQSSLGTLPDLLRTHGLAARLLDDVREDPWLTREVVRALGLPDLAVWMDWCAQMLEER